MVGMIGVMAQPVMATSVQQGVEGGGRPPVSTGPIDDIPVSGEPIEDADPGTSPTTPSVDHGNNTGCGGSLLGFKPWYDGLCANGQIKDVNGEAELTTFIWTIVLNVIFDLSLAVGYIAVAMVIYGGYLYIMSQGDPVRMAKGKKTLVAAISGVVIAMGATVIVNTLKLVLGISAGGWDQGTVTQERVDGVFAWAYGMAGLVAVIFIIKSGVDYLMSSGDLYKTKKATQGLIASVIGLVIVILASVITGFITSSLGGAM